MATGAYVAGTNIPQWKWNAFVTSEEDIDKSNGSVRIQFARLTLDLAAGILDLGSINNNEMVISTWQRIMRKCSKYLEADEKLIHRIVEEHLLLKHGSKEGWKGVEWYPKKSGVQIGGSCDVYKGTPMETRYFVKTHQYGPTSSVSRSVRSPDLKEVFIYKLLQEILMGPEAEFVVPSDAYKTNLYILTKGVNITLLSHLTPKTVNNEALLQIDLISRILCLRDCGTNPSNCGQVDGNPMIIDFRIEDQQEYSKPDILQRYYEGNGEFNYLELMKSATSESNDFKLHVLKKSMNKWNLPSSIQKAQGETESVKITAAKIEFYAADFQKYIDGIKQTVNTLQEAASSM